MASKVSSAWHHCPPCKQQAQQGVSNGCHSNGYPQPGHLVNTCQSQAAGREVPRCSVDVFAAQQSLQVRLSPPGSLKPRRSHDFRKAACHTPPSAAPALLQALVACCGQVQHGQPS